MIKSIMPPDLNTLFMNLKKDIFTNLNCIQIGKIDTYDKDTQSCAIKIQVKRQINEDETKEYPLLVDCPVFVLQGGGAYIDMPIKKDDYCLVLFSDRDIDVWWADENLAEPNTNRKHSLSDGFALVGINSKNNVLDLDGEKVRIITNDMPLEIYSKTKKIKIYNDKGYIENDADGNITSHNDNGDIELKSTGEINVKNASGKIQIDISGNIIMNEGTEYYVLGTTLKNMFTTLCVTIATATSGTTVQNAAGIETIKSAFSVFNGLLSTILSTTIKGK
jgi:hypothetical protein